MVDRDVPLVDDAELQDQSPAFKRRMDEDDGSATPAGTRRRVNFPASSGSEIDEPGEPNITDMMATMVREVTDEDDGGEDLGRHVTRNDQKALGREIPWRTIMKMNDQVRKQFEAAA